MILNDEEYKEHLAMLKASKLGAQGTLSPVSLLGGEYMNLKELTDNAYDIGMVSGVLQGIELTPTLLPNQKEAIADARKAIERIEQRNKQQLGMLKNKINKAVFKPL
jgi:hypothetical protein